VTSVAAVLTVGVPSRAQVVIPPTVVPEPRIVITDDA
jgi:hypothetical protein